MPFQSLTASLDPKRANTKPADPKEFPALTAARVLAASAGVASILIAIVLAVGFFGEGQYGAAAGIGALALFGAAYGIRRAARFLAHRGLAKRWEPQIDYEFTREGAIYLLTTGLITVASVNTGNNLLFMILAALLAGMLVSGVLSKTTLAGIKLDLALPEHIFAGETVRAQVTVTNTKRFMPSYSVTAGSGARTETAGKNILASPVYAPYVPAGGSLKEVVELRFARRGRYRQDAFVISTKFPFSVLRRKRRISAAREILVLPAIESSERFEKVIPLVRGDIESARKGHGSDLYGLRDYQDGDSASHVDWKASAKTRKLIVRDFTREEENRLTIIFDHRVEERSDAAIARFERGIRLCAFLAWQAHSGGSRESSLQFIGGNLRTRMAPASEIIFPVLEALAVLEPAVVDDADVLLPNVLGAEGFPVVISALPAESLAGSVPQGTCVLADF
ncbi:MAG: DUF58 domain-containing protein [Terriglobia bacterium]